MKNDQNTALAPASMAEAAKAAMRLERSFAALGKSFSDALTGKLSAKPLLETARGCATLEKSCESLQRRLSRGQSARLWGNWGREVGNLRAQLRGLSQVLGETLAAALTPAVSALGNFIGTLANAAVSFRSFVFTLFGQDSLAEGLEGTAEGAEDASEGLDEAAKSASGASRAARRALMSFDEINRLGSAGGSGGGGSSAFTGLGDYLSELDPVHFSSALAEKVRQAWQTADFTGIGEIFGNKISEALDKIDFEAIREALRKVAVSVATFFNGTLTGIDWSALGETISSAVKTAFDTVSAFLSTLNWRSLGESLRDAICGVDWGGMLQSVVSAFEAALCGLRDFVSGLLGDLLDDVGRRVTDWWALTKNFLENRIVGGVKEAAIDAVNFVIGKVNDLIARVTGSLQGTWLEKLLRDTFGIDLGAIAIPLVPMLDPSPSALYEQTKAEIEARSKNDPIESTAKAVFSGFAQNADGSVKGIGQVWTYAKAYFNAKRENPDGSIAGIGSTWSYAKAYFNEKREKADGSVAGIGSVWSYAKAYFNEKRERADGSIAGIGSVWSYAIAYFNQWKEDKGLQSGYGVWAYGTEYFNKWKETKALQSGDGVWSYGTEYFNQWENYKISPWSYSKAWFNSYDASKIAPSINAKAKFNTYDASSVSGQNISMTAKITKLNSSLSGVKLQIMGSGGVFANGHWNPIAQYAGGTSAAPFGQLFIAREAGPELVGTLGGHTAVVNNDQIVASVSAGVARAMQGMRFYSREASTPRLAVIGESARRSEEHLETLARSAQSARQGESTQTTALLREILETLRAMDLDIVLDGQSLTERVVSIINRNTRATGVCAIVT